MKYKVAVRMVLLLAAMALLLCNLLENFYQREFKEPNFEALSQVQIKGIHTMHNGTQRPLRLTPPLEVVLRAVSRRVLPRPSQEAVLRAVMVTGCDHTHYRELKDAIASAQYQFPNRVIIFYDLGLKDSQVLEIQALCAVRYRKFDFTKYPSHVRNLRLYAWKVLLTLELLQEFDSIFWLDSSIRLYCRLVFNQLAEVAGISGIAMPLMTYTSTYSVTNPEMYNYIAANLSVAKTTPMVGAGCFIIVNTKDIFEGVFQWLVRCSLNVDCIAPHNSSIFCNLGIDLYSESGNCHRYDQSALNLLLLHHFKGDVSKYSAPGTCIDVNRQKARFYTLRTCN